MDNKENLNNTINKQEEAGEDKGGRKKKNKKRAVIKGIIEWVIYILVFVLIVWGTPKGLSKALDSDYPIASITSSSMWPALKKGDIALIKGVSGKDDIAVSDIVVYTNERGFTIHRVVRKNDKTFITKGDANNTEDKPVEYDKLVGKVFKIKDKIFRIPYLGELSQIYRK